MELMVALLLVMGSIVGFCIGGYIGRNVICPIIIRHIIDALGIDEIDYNKADGHQRVRILEEKYQMHARLLMRRAVRATVALMEYGILTDGRANEIVAYLENAVGKLNDDEVHLVVFDNTRAIAETKLRSTVDEYNADAQALRRASKKLHLLMPRTFMTAWLYPQKLGSS